MSHHPVHCRSSGPADRSSQGFEDGNDCKGEDERNHRSSLGVGRCTSRDYCCLSNVTHVYHRRIQPVLASGPVTKSQMRKHDAGISGTLGLARNPILKKQLNSINVREQYNRRTEFANHSKGPPLNFAGSFPQSDHDCGDLQSGERRPCVSYAQVWRTSKS
jgi:hypothetical protein